jgi:sugar phosphate isomerase/epimerase
MNVVRLSRASIVRTFSLFGFDVAGSHLSRNIDAITEFHHYRDRGAPGRERAAAREMMMGKFRIACHMIVFSRVPRPQFSRMFAELAAAGYDGVEGMSFHSSEELVATATELGRVGMHLLTAHGVTPEETCRYNLTLGNTAVEISPSWRRYYGGDHPTDDDYRRAADSLKPVVSMVRGYGLKPYHHAHLESMIETVDEAEKLLALLPDLSLLLDTGHLAAGGCDPLDAVKRLGHRIGHVHLKDFWVKDPANYRRGEGKMWDDMTFEELGQGNMGIDFAAILKGLEDVGYDGWVSIEQDRTTKHFAPETARLNREYLRSLGY